MKDRFRFRVWNIEEKKMIYNAEIAYDGMNYNTDWQLGNNQNDGWVDCFGYYLDYEPQDYEIMQCTGLKDKNGKLIYEGDIVKDPSWWWGNCYIYLHRGECGPCKGDSVMSYILCKNIETPLEGACYNIWNGKEVEVIGNIYENKELLEDKQ